MPETLALSAALVFGLVHFFSGLLTRRADSLAVALFGQLGGVVLVGCAALVFPTHPTHEVTFATLAWGAVSGLVAGVGFALQFLAISRVDLDAGPWPVLVARLAAIATIVPIARHHRAHLRLPSNLVLPACVVGAAGSVAIVFYLLATHHQLLTLATVLAALYPAIPVVLALLFLHERLTRQQTAGLACTATAIALISLG